MINAMAVKKPKIKALTILLNQLAAVSVNMLLIARPSHILVTGFL
jgi:hypothetical protein